MFFENVPFVSLDTRWKVIQVHEIIKENYVGLLKPGFFTTLLNGYSPEYFFSPVALSAPIPELTGIQLVFIKDGDIVKCYPVRNEIYSGMSRKNVHCQMRAPISSILALIPVLADNISTYDSVQAVTSLEKVNRHSYKLLKNVTNVTLASEILNGILPVIETVNLSSLLESLIVSIKTVERNIDILCDIDKNIYIRGNQQMLTTAVLNLISNSINFRTDEHVEITIKLKKDDKKTILGYSDNSKGIQDKYLSEVFKRYFSKDPFADGESDPSMGLGLYIAKAAFEQAGGKIMLTSSFGNGVRYSVSLPLENGTDIALESSSTDFLLNRYSELFVQLCDSCRLPTLI